MLNIHPCHGLNFAKINNLRSQDCSHASKLNSLLKYAWLNRVTKRRQNSKIKLIDHEVPICLWLTVSCIYSNCWSKMDNWSSILCIIVLWLMRNSLADVTFYSNWLYFIWRPRISSCNYFNCFTICCYYAPIFLYILKFGLESLLIFFWIVQTQCNWMNPKIPSLIFQFSFRLS